MGPRVDLDADRTHTTQWMPSDPAAIERVIATAVEIRETTGSDFGTVRYRAASFQARIQLSELRGCARRETRHECERREAKPHRYKSWTRPHRTSVGNCVGLRSIVVLRCKPGKAALWKSGTRTGDAARGAAARHAVGRFSAITTDTG
jgi:hypothetical protein